MALESGVTGRFPTEGTDAEGYENIDGWGTPSGVASIGIEGRNVVGDLTGANAAEAAEDAAAQQVAAAEEALQTIRGDLAPYREPIAEQVMPQLLDFTMNPDSQVDFVLNNPLLARLQESAFNRITANRAARGKLGSGGTLVELQNQLVPLGLDFFNQRQNQMFDLARLGANAAAQTGTQSAGIMQGMGNAQAAGTIGAANAQAAGTQNLLNTAMNGYMMYNMFNPSPRPVGGAMAGNASGGITLSDERAKDEITEVGDIKGVKIYTYKYKGDDKIQMGVLAQEVEELVPSAVTEKDGVKYVNYGVLGEVLNAA